MTRIRIMCDQTDGTTIKLGAIETDKTGGTIYSARRYLTQDMYRDTVTPGRDVTHPECFGRFTVVALSYGGAIRKCMRRVAQMCAKHSACEQLDRQEARA